MKNKIVFFSIVTVMLLNFPAMSNVDKLQTLEEYNERLPLWGSVWNPGSDAVSRYYPSFYTGFAARSQFPDRIHVRTSRGNQTRVSVILDDQTLKDYLFDLEKRYKTYQYLAAKDGLLKIAARKNALPQLEYFYQIMESPTYDILGFVERAKSGQVVSEEVYSKALSVLEKLNPGRVFRLNINLNSEFAKWRDQLVSIQGVRNSKDVFTDNAKETVVALNTLLLGRINYTAKPSAEILSRLVELADLAKSNVSEQDFVQTALKLFIQITGVKYNLKVLNSNGSFQNAIQCNSFGQCVLTYPEFTAVYPTGSAEYFTNDKFGNRIQNFSTPGLWQFLSYNSSGRDFDNIRKEPFYGFAPKMDFEGIGNGFHNPAVTFWSVGKDVKNSLNIGQEFKAFGAVKRGGVSSGCLRLAVGHLWELRHIFPVENSVATKVFFFGNDSKDFDIFDINGDGRPELMGVEYMISYSVKGAGGLDKRDGDILDLKNKTEFYQNLYGKNQVFQEVNGKFVFTSPSISFPSHLDWKKKKVVTSFNLSGSFELYEQTYERDKVQFYAPVTTAGLEELSQAPLSKRIVRLMGRIRGCSPSSDKKSCGEAAFNSEAQSILKEAN